MICNQVDRCPLQKKKKKKRHAKHTRIPRKCTGGTNWWFLFDLVYFFCLGNKMGPCRRVI